MSKMDSPTPLLTREEIHQRVVSLGQEISTDYADTNGLVLVGVLRGSFVFLADLIREIDLAVEIEMISVMSYGDATKSTGHVRLIMDLQRDVQDCDVLIVEDIVDTGRTLNYLVETLKQRHPRTLRVCTLLDKPSRREIEAVPKYVGFEIPDRFVVGYGLDYAQRYRNLPYIGVLAEPQ
jgi:hypoxanthine phosphoribosyltransferase